MRRFFLGAALARVRSGVLCKVITKSADTVVGAETLARPGYPIEVDAIAVIDG